MTICRFSAALCRGLIEATWCARRCTTWWCGFPRLYVAASLKPSNWVSMNFGTVGWFSAALCRGLIEAASRPTRGTPAPRARFSAALCRGLIEAGPGCGCRPPPCRRFSAALCRGLIEAEQVAGLFPGDELRFSAALCRGLIEAPVAIRYGRVSPRSVFRGFMSRPH